MAFNINLFAISSDVGQILFFRSMVSFSSALGVIMAGTSRGTLHSISIKCVLAPFNVLKTIYRAVMFSSRPFKEHSNFEVWAGNPQQISCMQWFQM